jgi:hypothetical protein
VVSEEEGRDHSSPVGAGSAYDGGLLPMQKTEQT